MSLLKWPISSLCPLRRKPIYPNCRFFSSSAPFLKLRRVAPSLPKPRGSDETPAQILQRVSNYIEEGLPHIAAGYFNNKLSRGDVQTSARSQVYESVLDLFLRKKCFDEAEQVCGRMDKEGILLSQPLRAKVLALEYVRGQVHREVFMAALRDLFVAAGPRFGDEHFLDLLNHLVRAERPMETLESVVRLYIEVQGADYWLDSMSVAYMIARYHELKNKSDAERWLDYHSQRPCLDNSDITFSYPYSAHVHGLIRAAPEEEPKNIYGPILNRMQRDGAAPDTILINMLIRAELAHGHADSAVALYNVLREHHAQSIFPDETTFSSLFAAAGHRAKRTQDPFPLPPRVLFREMLELHAYLGTARIVTKVSLGAALWQFVVSGDYAGAYIALRTYAKLHIPFEILPIASVSDALVERCRRQLSLNSADTGPAWVDAFLDLRDVNRALLRRETPGATSRRMMDIAKRSLMLSEMADETKSYILQPSVLPVRKVKMNKIRTRRLQLVDTLLLRALAATFHLQPKKLPITTDVSDRLAQKAIEKAVEDMIPPKRSKAPQTKTNPAQEVNDANECL